MLLKMKLKFLKSLIAAAILPALLSSAFADLPAVLGKDVNGVAPTDQMRRHLLDQVDATREQWKAAFENRTDLDEIRAHYWRLHSKMLEAIGGLPERTPLNPRVTGTIKADGFQVDNVIFESRPGFYVTANLYLPDPTRDLRLPADVFAPRRRRFRRCARAAPDDVRGTRAPRRRAPARVPAECRTRFPRR